GGASHVSLNALDRHVVARDGGSHSPYPDLLCGKSVRPSLTLMLQPETRDLVQCLSGATSAILHALDALERIFPQKGIERTMKRYAALWAKLVGRCENRCQATLFLQPANLFGTALARACNFSRRVPRSVWRSGQKRCQR